MVGKKEYAVTFTESQYAFLTEMAKKYDLADESKAVRCLVNYAVERQGEWDSVFAEIRCLDC